MARRPHREKRKVQAEGRLEKARRRARQTAKPAWEPTDMQVSAQKAFRDVDILCLSGPPGSGKTATGVWLAIEELLSGRARKLYLVRPAVEAGERLGYLPGTVQEKLHPYALPVYEFIRSLGLNPQDMLKDGTLEVVPLGLCKGRTFHGGVVLLEEAQDATKKQLRLVLGRLGANSKLIITGDPKQADVVESPNAFQGLVAKFRVADEGWYKLYELTEADILRHEHVGDLLRMCE